jgi:hypothetical protein
MRRLFEANTRAIGNLPGPLACDAVPDSMTCGTPSELRDDLVRFRDALTNRWSSCSRNQVARNGHRAWRRLDNQDIEATVPIMS